MTRQTLTLASRAEWSSPSYVPYTLVTAGDQILRANRWRTVLRVQQLPDGVALYLTATAGVLCGTGSYLWIRREVNQ